MSKCCIPLENLRHLLPERAHSLSALTHTPSAPCAAALVNFYRLLNEDGRCERLRFHSAPEAKPRAKARAVKPEDAFVYVLVLIKTGLELEVAEVVTGVDATTGSRYFVQWLRALSLFFRKMFPYPTREQVMQCMPPRWVEVYGTDLVRLIIDATELPAEGASSLEAARAQFSHYKHGYTGKFLGGITPIGAFAYASDVYGGRITDPTLVEVSGLLDLIEKDDCIVADRGFLINDMLSKLGAQCK